MRKEAQSRCDKGVGDIKARSRLTLERKWVDDVERMASVAVHKVSKLWLIKKKKKKKKRSDVDRSKAREIYYCANFS